MKIKTIEIPIYHGSLTFIKDKNFKKLKKKYGIFVPSRYGAVTAKNERSKRFECLVCFVDSNVSLMAHEAVHVCNYIFENVGIKLCTENDEAQAYLIGWIVDEMETFLNEIK